MKLEILGAGCANWCADGVAAVWMIALRRSIVVGLLAAGLVGVVVALAGLPVGS